MQAPLILIFLPAAATSLSSHGRHLRAATDEDCSKFSSRRRFAGDNIDDLTPQEWALRDGLLLAA